MKAATGVLFGVLALAMSAMASLVVAQDKYPERPIRLVIPFSPGGGNDTVGRRFAAAITPLLGQQVVVDNRAGAGGDIGAYEVARATADGYTLLFGSSSTHVINPLSKTLPYDPVKSFSMIALLGKGIYLVAVHPIVAGSLNELIKRVKAKPGQYAYATVAGMAKFAADLFKKQAGGLDMTYVPYKGTGSGIVAVIGGEIPSIITVVSGALPYHRSGRLRILAVFNEERSKAAPDIPTAVELGVPGLVAYSMMILCAPANTPKPIINKLYQATMKIVRDEVFQNYLDRIGTEPVTDSSPEMATQFVQRELAKWGPIIKGAGWKPD